MSSKSAGYCCPHISGGDALLLLCEAELGDPMQELKSADSNAGGNALQIGKHSTMGLGRTGPAQWKDAACVNESLKGVKMVCFVLRPQPRSFSPSYALHVSLTVLLHTLARHLRDTPGAYRG